MKIKVCGLKHPDNIQELSRLAIDYMGLIFYEKSPRYAGGLEATDLPNIPSSIRLTGVFVDKDLDYILEKIQKYRLQTVQLHGTETPEFCRKLKESLSGDCGLRRNDKQTSRNDKCTIIKVFPIENAADLRQTADYESVCDYFLFDTKTPQHGGSGKKFDWKMLSEYAGQTPFFLSGGIDLEDAKTIKQLTLHSLYAIDINSKFEIKAGKKDINKIARFIELINN
ncbi:N-(5'-phosphoribosyl)anthranilate isomerase [Bacteroidia bacterium]|nr:N-(5'-phosphoribosyl)anthranilate isomerase [Bacteroidia bacterium]